MAVLNVFNISTPGSVADIKHTLVNALNVTI